MYIYLKISLGNLLLSFTHAHFIEEGMFFSMRYFIFASHINCTNSVIFFWFGFSFFGSSLLLFVLTIHSPSPKWNYLWAYFECFLGNLMNDKKWGCYLLEIKQSSNKSIDLDVAR